MIILDCPQEGKDDEAAMSRCSWLESDVGHDDIARFPASLGTWHLASTSTTTVNVCLDGMLENRFLQITSNQISTDYGNIYADHVIILHAHYHPPSHCRNPTGFAASKQQLLLYESRCSP